MTKGVVKSLIAGMTVATLLVPVSVPAQEADNVGHGRQIAQTKAKNRSHVEQGPALT